MTIRLGTCSPATQPTTPQSLSLLSSIAQRASAKHIDILLFPEAFLGGYPRGSHFGSVVGSRSEAGRDEFATYFKNAIDLGDIVGDGGAGGGDRWLRRELPVLRLHGKEGEHTRGDGTREELERIAQKTGVFLVIGLVERSGGSLYCSVVYVCPHVGTLGKRRKVLPTGTERLIWAQSHPSTLKAVSTVIRGQRINMAAAICWENYMPLLRQTLYAQNINLYLAPTADARDAWLSLMRTVSVEGRCFVLSSNMAVQGPQQDGDSGVPDRTQLHQHRGRGSPAVGDRDIGVIDEEAEENGADLERTETHCTVTEEGHEIALPKDGGDSNSPQGRRIIRKRRKSIMDEDGNEIVLCCDDEENTLPGHSETNGDADIAASGEEVLHHRRTSSRKPRPTTWISRGGSSIVGPFGDVLAGPQWEEDHELIYADVDLTECIKGRLDIDTAGSYSRNDVFKLSIEWLDLDPLPYV